MTDDEVLIRRTYELAKAAVENGNFPFGALVAVDGEVVLTSENTVESERDVAGHPELKLARRAPQELDPDKLASATLYASGEPCPMCAGAIYWSQIPRVVYGVSAESARSASGSEMIPSLPCADVLGCGGRDVESIGPVLEEVGLSIHREFWADPPDLSFSTGRTDAEG